MAQRMPALPWMDSIRAVACAVVVVWHAFLTIVPTDPTDGQQLVSLPLGVAAREAVVVFVVLSGYSLGRHWRGGFDRSAIGSTFRTYMVRRTWRLVPTYWAALALTIVAMLVFGLDRAEGTHWDTGLPLTLARVGSNVAGLTDVLGQVPLSHQTWTVPVEYHLYLLAPVVVLARSRRAMLAVFSVLTVVVLVVLPHYPATYFVFAFGAAFWLGLKRQSLAPTDEPARVAVTTVLPIAAVSLVLLAIVATTSPMATESQQRYFMADALVAPVFLAWLLHHDLSGGTSRLLRALSWSGLRRLGDISYSQYLVHGVVLEMLWRFAVRPLDLAGDTQNIVLLAVVGYPITALAAVGLYLAVERPTMPRSSARPPLKPSPPGSNDMETR